MQNPRILKLAWLHVGSRVASSGVVQQESWVVVAGSLVESILRSWDLELCNVLIPLRGSTLWPRFHKRSPSFAR